MFRAVKRMTYLSERLFVVLAVVLCSVIGQVRVAYAQAGVVVEEVAKGSAGEKADIRAGDILLAWERSPSPPVNPEKAQGKIESVFDWMWVEMEQGPRGMLKVSGERDGKETTFEVPVGTWGIKVRPRFDGDALKTYLEGKAAVSAKELEKGMALWVAVVKSAEAGGDIGLALWMNLRMGDTWTEARRWKEAEAAYEWARERSEREVNVVAQGVMWDSIGRAFERKTNLERRKRLMNPQWPFEKRRRPRA